MVKLKYEIYKMENKLELLKTILVGYTEYNFLNNSKMKIIYLFIQ